MKKRQLGFGLTLDIARTQEILEQELKPTLTVEIIAAADVAMVPPSTQPLIQEGGALDQDMNETAENDVTSPTRDSAKEIELSKVDDHVYISSKSLS